MCFVQSHTVKSNWIFFLKSGATGYHIERVARKAGDLVAKFMGDLKKVHVSGQGFGAMIAGQFTYYVTDLYKKLSKASKIKRLVGMRGKDHQFLG